MPTYAAYMITYMEGIIQMHMAMHRAMNEHVQTNRPAIAGVLVKFPIHEPDNPQRLLFTVIVTRTEMEVFLTRHPGEMN